MDTHETPASGSAAGFPALDLGPAARRVAKLLDGVDDARLDAPTPCPDYAVRELLGHLLMLTAAFRDAARKDLGPGTATDPGAVLPILDEGWRAALPLRLAEVAAAWRSPGAWAGMTRAGGVELPGEAAGAVALDELVVHGWDLARSTGQPYEAGEAELLACAALLAPDEEDPDRGGIFGPPVPVPDDAPLLDRVIALSGRRPDWLPGG
ncbi:TIGR03086 family metal-binding protein [Streptomyces sp. NPDC101181]|uniref:TIGR03086 family metal-binding protein n=1 Tax=Streptomyces sp. NPDC101181 TaxID=3366125 RepID=UPI0038187AE5